MPKINALSTKAYCLLEGSMQKKVTGKKKKKQ